MLSKAFIHSLGMQVANIVVNWEKEEKNVLDSTPVVLSFQGKFPGRWHRCEGRPRGSQGLERPQRWREGQTPIQHRQTCASLAANKTLICSLFCKKILPILHGENDSSFGKLLFYSVPFSISQLVIDPWVFYADNASTPERRDTRTPSHILQLTLVCLQKHPE